MDHIFQMLEHHALFESISPANAQKALGCFHTSVKRYQKDEIVFLSGDAVEKIGMVLSGAVRIVQEDFSGNRTILTELRPFELLLEVFACAEVLELPVTVEVTETAELLLFDYQQFIAPCSTCCSFHSRLICNMLKIMAQKNLKLHQKNQILSKRTMREKLWCFFDLQRQGRRQFTIPFNRSEMAAYLGVDRSALSSTLSKMQQEGLIKFSHNTFEVCEDDASSHS